MLTTFRCVLSRSTKAEATEPAKRHTWKQRQKDFQNIAAYKDVAEWLTDIAKWATRQLKRKGVIEGRQKVSVARVIDPYLREVAWRTLWKIRHAEAGTPRATIPPLPDPPEPSLDLELPG